MTDAITKAIEESRNDVAFGGSGTLIDELGLMGRRADREPRFREALSFAADSLNRACSCDGPPGMECGPCNCIARIEAILRGEK